MLEHLLIDAADLRDALLCRQPLDAERLGQSAPQRRLVEEARRSGMGLQRMAVERRRPTLGDRRVGDDRVGVELRIAGTRASMAKRGGDQPFSTYDPMSTAPTARPRRVALDVAQRLFDSTVMCVADYGRDGPISDAEED